MEDLIEKKDGELLQKHACDSSDYLIAVACGAVSGLVDIFLVGAPSQSVIGKWTDAQVDEAVKKFAEKSGWSPRPGKEGNVASAIGYLERQYKVNYDQRYSADVGGAFNMSTKNHHIKSLSHSPDIIGLFFSVLNQFTSTSSFVSGGKLVTIKTESFELQGNNLVSKVFCGIVNWLDTSCPMLREVLVVAVTLEEDQVWRFHFLNSSNFATSESSTLDRINKIWPHWLFEPFKRGTTPGLA